MKCKLVYGHLIVPSTTGITYTEILEYHSFDKSQVYLQLGKNPKQKLKLTIKYLAVTNV
ncbi:hypothetical protein RO3G_11286 [Rhizopus delemar RA 99-880]|uniref:Uncharacterized protein n=1 Tax=Rhizopus delemar (strain RA 99-880 / ATCC MYA-4621 / FGSC 9543 / NRRL 43880) TaxID=246409 RepID=I1CDP5_RHIO9|nr:hypothetical protein RO3G_11286 [Rhizopus delemar RA 99-880]|eukprot:EIE86575.1 hypothetical protein RO3G_11286 [Rhizopus delemar RA 99-880]